MKHPQTISVIGAGSWGSALAQLLATRGLPVTVWAHEAAQAEEINTRHTNHLFLPGVTLAPNIRATADLTAAARADLLVVVPPSQFLKSVAQQLSQS
ncbi:MAG: 2-dehydropantoate 2-reductase N-terminal domain-containing protein, partial [Chthoniobacterales bacterium]